MATAAHTITLVLTPEQHHRPRRQSLPQGSWHRHAGTHPRQRRCTGLFGVLSGRLKGAGGEDIAAEEQADIALAVIAIVKENHIVDVWSNDVAQNKMRNAIDDYFFDELRDHRGIELPVDLLDDLEQRLMDLARARFPD